VRHDRFPLLRIVFGTWRRLLPSPRRVLRGMFTPRRLFHRFRLRWVVLFFVACFVWLVAATEPAPPEPGLGSALSAQATAVDERPASGVGRPVASSPEAASRFFHKMARAVQAGIKTGHMDLSITETEATSALDVGAQLVEIRQIMSTLSPEELEALDTPEEIRRALDTRAARAPSGLWGRIRYALNPRLRLRQAQVRFHPDGRVLVSGYAQAWSRRVRVYMDAVPTLEDGRLRMDYRETRLGRLRVPGRVLRGPGDLLTMVLGLGRDYAGLETLSVGDGRLTMSGHVRLPREP